MRSLEKRANIVSCICLSFLIVYFDHSIDSWTKKEARLIIVTKIFTEFRFTLVDPLVRDFRVPSKCRGERGKMAHRGKTG